jgi:hypothetical protein
LNRGSAAPRAPQVVQTARPGRDEVVFENYDAAPGHYGYLRIIANDAQLRIEYHPASDGANHKSPDDSVTVDLKTRKITHFAANGFGWQKEADRIRKLTKM